MRKLIFVFIPVFFIFLTHCEKDTDSNTSDKKITFLKTNLGGCHGADFDNLKNATVDYADTIKFSIINEDTLNVFVGINYICCAPFDTETDIVNDTLIMVISDICTDPYSSCYYRCECYYTWDFQYIDYEKKEYNYLVKLKDPREDNTIILKQGVVDLSK